MLVLVGDNFLTIQHIKIYMKKIFIKFTMIPILYAIFYVISINFTVYAESLSEPLKYREINELVVHYVRLPNDKFSPANVDHESKIVYIWEDIQLTYDQVPNNGVHASHPLIFPKEYGFQVKVGSPSLHFIRNKKHIDFGYYDQTAKVLYRWKGFTYLLEDIPEAYEKYEIKEDHKRVVIVDVPTPYKFWERLFIYSSDDEKKSDENL